MAWLACFAFAFAFGAAGCGERPSSSQPEAAERPKIATTERGPRGGRLVFLSERGVRLAELTRSLPTPTLDSNPAWSPDGRHVAFASTRGESLETTRLWIVSAETGQEPRRLTRGAAIERDPRWEPGGRGLIYAGAVSSKSGEAKASIDLYRVALEPGEGGVPQIVGAPARLTRSRGHELSPSVSADGKHVAYMEISPSSKDSRLRLLSLATGASRDLTAGPLDVTPAFDPENSARIAYASRADGRDDMDIFLLDIESGKRTALPSEELADLTGPVWSIDGRHLLATAVFRSVATGDPILSSVVVIDLWDKKPVWRALHDPAFTESRIGAAVAPRALLPSLINSNRPYREALAVAINEHLIRRTEEIREKTRELKKNRE